MGRLFLEFLEGRIYGCVRAGAPRRCTALRAVVPSLVGLPRQLPRGHASSSSFVQSDMRRCRVCKAHFAKLDELVSKVDDFAHQSPTTRAAALYGSWDACLSQYAPHFSIISRQHAFPSPQPTSWD